MIKRLLKRFGILPTSIGITIAAVGISLLIYIIAGMIWGSLVLFGIIVAIVIPLILGFPTTYVFLRSIHLLNQTEEALQQRNRELNNLYEAAVAINTDLAKNAVLNTIGEQATHLFEVNGCTLSLWNREENLLETLADYNVTHPETAEQRGEIYALEAYPVTRQVLETKRPRQIQPDDPTADEAELALMEEEGVLSLLMVPLIARGQVIGLMELYDDVKKKIYTPEEILLAQSLAIQAAAALEHAQLYLEAQEMAMFNKSIIQNMAEGVAVEDEEGIFTFINPAGAEMLGYTIEELVGTHWTAIIPPDQHPIVVAADKRRKRGEIDRYELELVRKDSERISVIVGGCPRFDEKDRFVGTIAVYTDITNRKRAEKALQQQAERLEILHRIDQAILAAESPEAIAQAALSHFRQLVPCKRASVAIFDRDGDTATILAVHPSGKTRLGPGLRMSLETADLALLERGEIQTVDKTEDLVAPPARVQNLQAEGIRAYINIPLIVRGQLIGTLNVGLSQPGALSQQDLAIATGIADQLAIAIQNARLHQDVQRHADQLARALEQLQMVDLLKTEFIQNVSHELRTPLGIARGYIELLDSGELGDLKPEQRKPVNIAVRRLRMLSQLVEDITATLELETRKPQQESVDLGELVNRALDHFEILAEREGLTLKAEVAHGLPPVIGDETYLYRVLDNLLSNAIKFTPTGGSVTVHLQKRRENLILKVVDTGIGIPPEKQAHIFERFYQVDGSIKRRYGGVGLGLALVKEIVELHSGSVEVESQPGQGSTFTIVLPIPS